MSKNTTPVPVEPPVVPNEDLEMSAELNGSKDDAEQDRIINLDPELELDDLDEVSTGKLSGVLRSISNLIM